FSAVGVDSPASWSTAAYDFGGGPSEIGCRSFLRSTLAGSRSCRLLAAPIVPRFVCRLGRRTRYAKKRLRPQLSPQPCAHRRRHSPKVGLLLWVRPRKPEISVRFQLDWRKGCPPLTIDIVGFFS